MTGRAYGVHVIRVIEVKQVADVADGLVAGRGLKAAREVSGRSFGRRRGRNPPGVE